MELTNYFHNGIVHLNLIKRLNKNVHMRKGLFITIAVIFGTVLHAQVQDPVDWKFSSKKINPTTYEVRLTAKLDDGWHIYSQTTADGGPVPTSISFAKNPLLSTSGAVKEIGKLEKHFEPLFGVEVKQYSDKVEFVQTVTVKPGIKTSVAGTVEFMTCNDRECLPPKAVKFAVPLN